MSNTELLIREVQTLPERDADITLTLVNALKARLDLAAISAADKPSETDPAANAVWYGLYHGCWHSHIFNAETRAAIEEGRAMMRGEIPANKFKTLDEAYAWLESD